MRRLASLMMLVMPLVARAEGAAPPRRPGAGKLAARAGDADVSGREVPWRGGRTCELRGRAATLDLVVVSPPGEAPIQLAVAGQPATVHLAPPTDATARHHVAVAGALAFEGQAPGEWAHFVTTRAVTAQGGMVRLASGVRLGEVRWGGAGSATATVDLDRAARLPGLPIPCPALGLDEPASADGLEAPRDGRTDGTFWVARGSRLTVRPQPGEGAAYAIDVEYPPGLMFGRLRSQGRFALVDSWLERSSVAVTGWIDEVELESYLPYTYGAKPPPADKPVVESVRPPPKGVYEGPATIAAGTPVFAAAGGRGPWAVVRDDRGLRVRWKPEERWVELVGAPGLSGLSGHAFLDRAAVRLPLAPGAWRVTGAPVSSRLGHTATLLRDGRVLVVGGWGPLADDPDRRVPLASCELFDPDGAAERFTATGGLATGRAGHTATLLEDGRVLVAGGEWNPPGEEGIALGSVEVYDPRTGLFSPAAPLAKGRIGHTATLLSDGTVLLVGGEDGHGRSLESAELWDPRDGHAHPAGHLGTRRYDHSATRLPSGKVLITGGRHKNYALKEWWTTFPIDSVELYDPASHEFAPAGELPAGGRTRHSATLVGGGRVLLAGGARETDLDLAGIARSALLYEPGEGQWTRAGDSTAREEEARGEHSATPLPDGRVLIVSGAYALLYDPASRRFESLAGPTFERSGHTATRLPDGRILVVGGEPLDESSARAVPSRPGAELFLPPR